MTNPYDPRTIRDMAAEIEPHSPEQWAQLQEAIRRHNSTEIQEILRSLKPHIDGSYGPVNPRLIEVYFKGLAEIAKLYRVYDPPRTAEEEKVQERAAEQLRELAEKQLREIAERSANGG
jgi:DNA-binding protein H-NS